MKKVILWLVAIFLFGAVEVVEAQQPKKKAADRVSLGKADLRRALALAFIRACASSATVKGRLLSVFVYHTKLRRLACPCSREYGAHKVLPLSNSVLEPIVDYATSPVSFQKRLELRPVMNKLATDLLACLMLTSTCPADGGYGHDRDQNYN